MVVANVVIAGSEVHFRLSGGSKATSLYQIVSVLCSTTAGQIMEEDARVTLLS